MGVVLSVLSYHVFVSKTRTEEAIHAEEMGRTMFDVIIVDSLTMYFIFLCFR